MIDIVVLNLLRCFRGSFVNSCGEFIANDKANSYFTLANCKDEMEVKCKILEWLSRDSFKAEPFSTRKKNEEFHITLLNGINQFLMTDFSLKDMELIYQELGNQINRARTIKFIESGYDLKVLDPEE